MQPIHQVDLEKCTCIVKKFSVLDISAFYSDDTAADWKED
jgi:hypothetical protein